MSLLASHTTTIRITVPPRWLTPVQFEEVIAGHNFFDHLTKGGKVVFHFPLYARLPAGLGLWFLSFLNQLAAVEAGQIHLEFADAEGLFGYLDRNGFLSLLSPRIETTPERPSISSADVHRGRTQGLVEIQPLNPNFGGAPDNAIVTRLVDALIDFYPAGSRTQQLRNHVFTVFGELVDNVFSHSRTLLPGYASLQAYDKQSHPRVQIGVSDSGLGIPASLRETLGERIQKKTDAELVIQAFRQGLSRHGRNAGRGCGLPRCAELAAEYGSTVSVRTPLSHVTLNPARPNHPYLEAQILNPVGRLDGTHVYLEFRVDGM